MGGGLDNNEFPPGEWGSGPFLSFFEIKINPLEYCSEWPNMGNGKFMILD